MPTGEVKKAEKPIIKKKAIEVEGDCRTIMESMKTFAAGREPTVRMLI